MHAADSSEKQHHPGCSYAVECGAARMSIFPRSLATVLRVDGEIDLSNASRLAGEIRRFTEVQTPLILDLSHLDFLGIAGFRELLALNYHCHAVRLYCSIVAGAAMRPLLRVVTDHGLPIVESLPEALQLIDDALAARRQFVSRLAR